MSTVTRNVTVTIRENFVKIRMAHVYLAVLNTSLETLVKVTHVIDIHIRCILK